MDDDWLVLRAGTGRLASRIIRGGSPVGEHPEVAAVPATVDLQRTAVVGVSGPRPGRLALAGSLVSQACAWHSPRRLRIVLLSAADVPTSDWDWAQLLPHLLDHQTGEILCRADVRDPARLAALIASLTTLIGDRRSTQSTALSSPPGEATSQSVGDLLVVLDGARELRSVPGVAELLRLGPAAGFRFLCLDEDRSSLPTEATSVVELDDRGHRATMTLPDQVIAGITLDLPRSGWLEQMGRAMAPLIDATPQEQRATLPARVGFRELHRSKGLDPLDPRDLETAWSGPIAPPRALLGLTPSGPHEVDLTRDGPHALVGGTTGSGKSELLQALVAGLAAAHRPDDLGFVLIDYKGGAAFRECERLPHTLGVVTDLDEHLTARALASLSAELRRRERLLAQAGAKDIESLHRLEGQEGRHARLPRLVIVVDEFKLLADELPDFVHGLVQIAAKGRSLGVHLVLATQRPAGIITGDMRSNVSLRICLRVRDRADSEDVINDPAASTLTDLAAGRAYLRAGDGRLVALQTAHVGGPVEEPGAERRVVVTTLSEEPIGNRSGRPTAEAQVTGTVTGTVTGAVTVGGIDEGREGTTELAAFVEVARQVATTLGITTTRSPWLPPLPEWLGVDDLVDSGSSSCIPDQPHAQAGVPFGLVDRPHDQQQLVARWDPDVDGHLGVIGGSRSGRTTLVRTLVAALAQRRQSSELHVHVLEGTPGPLKSLAEIPHVG
ncbi:MAG TPA: FtsK/SpoIIIE domain-containing protein, partial [Candidatus Nanopelagicales bacterium]|nr:FtsK/SpoIIIE domain-containing protein [Candidatus Nanopelagicales bacterium]